MGGTRYRVAAKPSLGPGCLRPSLQHQKEGEVEVKGRVEEATKVKVKVKLRRVGAGVYAAMRHNYGCEYQTSRVYPSPTPVHLYSCAVTDARLVWFCGSVPNPNCKSEDSYLPHDQTEPSQRLALATPQQNTRVEG